MKYTRKFLKLKKSKCKDIHQPIKFKQEWFTINSVLAVVFVSALLLRLIIIFFVYFDNFKLIN